MAHIIFLSDNIVLEPPAPDLYLLHQISQLLSLQVNSIHSPLRRERRMVAISLAFPHSSARSSQGLKAVHNL